MLNKLKGWITPNTVTKDPNDKILLLEPADKVGLDKIYEEMRAEDTGLRQETIVHVVSLFERIVARLLMNGYHVNTGLFYAVPRFLGLIEKGRWNPEKNSIYVSFTQDKVLREEIAKTEVVIQGEKADVMYIIDVEDRSNGLSDGSITPGRNMALRGAYLRVEGEHPNVGIRFINRETKVETAVATDMFAVNNPAEVVFLVPSGLADGHYDLVLSTQYMKGKGLLKEPRSITTTVHVGKGGSGGESESPDEV